MMKHAPEWVGTSDPVPLDYYARVRDCLVLSVDCDCTLMDFSSIVTDGRRNGPYCGPSCSVVDIH